MRKLILAAAIAALSPAALAQEVTIKLGTLAPAGSTWHELLKDMAERWSQASGGRVRLRIYPGGTQGSEGDMVRKMSIGQLQAASITSVGMHDIVKETGALTTPGMIGSEGEYQAVFGKIEPQLDALLAQHGYVAIQWARLGFAHFYCTKPHRTPAEMSEAKVFSWEGDPASAEAWRAAGFRPVVLSSTDVVPALQTGMINCINNVALYMLTSRLFEKASNMIAENWAFLNGATLVKKDAWEKIPADVRPKLVAIARELGGRVDAEVKKLNGDAIAAMKGQGLNVVEVDPAPWRIAAERTWPVIRGKVVPAAFFDEVKRYRDEYRAASRR